MKQIAQKLLEGIKSKITANIEIKNETKLCIYYFLRPEDLPEIELEDMEYDEEEGTLETNIWVRV